MPRFKLVPKDKSIPAFEYDGLDAGSAINIASQMGFEESQLWHNDAYVCSLHQVGGTEGSYWVIVRNNEAATQELRSAAN